MKKLNFLILLVLLNSFNTYAQTSCSCEDNLLWVKKIFEENDAGFQYVIDKKGIAAYKTHTAEQLEKAKAAKTSEECQGIVYNWLKFFRARHLAFFPTQNDANKTSKSSAANVDKNWATYAIDQPKFEAYLATKKDADFEGIWALDAYVVGIIKVENEYKGFIISSSNENWQPKDIKLKISGDKKTAVYYSKDKTAIPINTVEMMGENYLALNQFTFKRVLPKFATDASIEQYYKSVNARLPYIDQLNKHTLIFRIPSFEDMYKKAIDSVIAINKTKIETTENLIIDLRNNGGGSDFCFDSILPYLYTNPIRTIQVAFLSTPLNNKQFEDYLLLPDLSKKDSIMLVGAIKKLKNNMGKFVVPTDSVTIEKFDTIFPYPKNIAILINERCASTTEQFLLSAKQSKKVKLFGTTTMGTLDISNTRLIETPCKDFTLVYAWSKSLGIPEIIIDDIGIQPDFYMDKTIPKYKWMEFVEQILLTK